MFRRFVLPTLAACALLVPLDSSAQLDRSDVLIVADPDCAQYMFVNIPDASATAQDMTALVASCIGTASTALDKVEDELDPDNHTLPNAVTELAQGMEQDAVTDDELNLYLIRRHYEYKRLKKALTRLDAVAEVDDTTDDTALAEYFEARRDLIVLGETLHDLLDRRGLRQSFSSALVTGGALNHLGSDGGAFGGVPMSDSGLQEQVQVHLAWESRHIGASGNNPVEFSLRGRLGFVPAIALLQTDTAALNLGADTISARFKNAFVWTLGTQLSRPVSSKMEVGLVGLAGQTRLNAPTELVQRGDQNFLQLSLVDNDSRMAWFGEVGLEFKAFDNPLEVLHAENDFLSPLFSISAGYKWDARFRAEDNLITKASAPRRFFFRFMIDALKVVDERKVAEEGKTFTVGFGVEYERSWFGLNSPVPSSTRFLIRGDLNFLKALRGG